MTSIPLALPVHVRRRRGHEPSKKATFQIRESILNALKDLANQGAVPNMSVLVEQALEQKLRDMRRDKLYAAYAAAAADAEFVSELEATSKAFDGVSADGLQ